MEYGVHGGIMMTQRTGGKTPKKTSRSISPSNFANSAVGGNNAVNTTIDELTTN